MASIVFNVAKGAFADGTLDWDGDDIRVLLLSDDTDIDTDLATVAAVLGEAGNTEITTTGYTRKVIANRAVAVNSGDDRAELDGDDAEWLAIGDNTQTAVAALVYQHDAGGDSASVPIAYVDFTDTTLNGGDFTVQWSSDGIITLS